MRDQVALNAVAGGLLESAHAAHPALALAAVAADDSQAYPFAAAGRGIAVAELAEPAILVPGGDDDRRGGIGLGEGLVGLQLEADETAADPTRRQGRGALAGLAPASRILDPEPAVARFDDIEGGAEVDLDILTRLGRRQGAEDAGRGRRAGADIEPARTRVDRPAGESAESLWVVAAGY